jgi:rsbT co-antagonist protein RsbR
VKLPDTRLAEIIGRHETDVLSEWLNLQIEAASGRHGHVSETQLRTIAAEFLTGFIRALERAPMEDVSGPDWSKVREILAEMSRQRAAQGFTQGETAMFVLSLKKPLFGVLRKQFARDAGQLAEATWTVTYVLDQLALYTTELHQRTRENVIQRQQAEMLELSTPVVELWQGILALPLIGTLDSARTQVVMQNLLEAIVAKGADIAIIDITGVPTVDTLVAQHLLKTVAAARLMGAECLISGIRPQIAQTIIHLGVELAGVITKATLADAFRIALKRRNVSISAN